MHKHFGLDTVYYYGKAPSEALLMQEGKPSGNYKAVEQWWDEYKEVWNEETEEYDTVLVEPAPETTPVFDDEGSETGTKPNPAYRKRGVWVEFTPETTIEDIRAEKKERLKAPLVIDGVTFDGDTAAETAYIKHFIKFSSDPTYVVESWKASNGTYVTMGAVLFGKVMAAIEQRDTETFAWYKAEYEKIGV